MSAWAGTAAGAAGAVCDAGEGCWGTGQTGAGLPGPGTGCSPGSTWAGSAVGVAVGGVPVVVPVLPDPAVAATGQRRTCRRGQYNMRRGRRGRRRQRLATSPFAGLETRKMAGHYGCREDLPSWGGKRRNEPAGFSFQSIINK